MAILLQEPGHEELLQTMTDANAAIGTAALAETAVVHSARLGVDVRLANEPLLFAGEDFARTDIARP